MRNSEAREIIFEFSRVGQAIRVTAMDTQTLTEVVISAPVGRHHDYLKKIARDKLYYVLRKKGIIKD